MNKQIAHFEVFVPPAARWHLQFILQTCTHHKWGTKWFHNHTRDARDCYYGQVLSCPARNLCFSLLFWFHDYITANSTGSEAVRQAKLLCDIQGNLQLFLHLWASVSVGWCAQSLSMFKCPTFRKSFQYPTKFACLYVCLYTWTYIRGCTHLVVRQQWSCATFHFHCWCTPSWKQFHTGFALKAHQTASQQPARSMSPASG